MERTETETVGQPGELRLRDALRWDGAQWVAWLRRMTILVSGLFLFALALVLSLQSNLGANSWTVLHDGISRHTPLTIGQATQLTGLMMLALSWMVGIRPGIGTVLNMVVVGLFMDLILVAGLIDLAGPYPWRVLMLASAIALLGVASGMYISSGLGAGPRDSFMLALTEITGLPVHVIRWMIEITVITVGALLGGSFGVGTIIFVLLVGPAVGLGFRMFGLPVRKRSKTPVSRVPVRGAE